MNSKDRIFATIRGQPRDRIAVTPLFMQFAAQFSHRTFRDYYLNGEVLAACQIAVARAFNTDHVTCMGEPFAEADSYGMQFDYPDNTVGIPRGYLLHQTDDVKKLRKLDPFTMPRLRERIKCISKLYREAGDDKCVVGWVEGPIAEYSNLRGMQDTMLDLIDRPEMFNAACEMIVENAVTFGAAQADAGACIVGVGDAAASLIGPELYRTLVLPWEQKLIAGLKRAGVPVKLHICGNISKILPDVAKTGADIIDIDWMVPLKDARKMVGPAITLAGNFDPSSVLLMGTPTSVADAARKCITDAGDRFILQPGCEVPPNTPEENLRAFCPGTGSLIADALTSPSKSN